MTREERCAINTRLHAEKQHKLAVNSLRYLMENMPEPVLLRKTYTAKPYTFPEVEGLCKSRTWSVEERVAVTMCFMNCSPKGMGNLGTEGFLVKSIRQYLPEGILLNPEWFNNEKRIRSKDVIAAVKDFRDWYDQYMLKIENLLTELYLESGDRSGRHYIEVLQRRFRANWNPNSLAFKASLEKKVEEPVETKDEVKPTTVSFNFEVVARNDV